MKPTMRSALVAVGAVGALAAGTLPATAAPGDQNPSGNGQSVQQLSCTGLGDVWIRTNNNNSSDMGGWSAAQIVGGDATGTLIPTSFTFEAFDVTTGHDLFPAGSQVKGGGNGNHQQATVLCTQQFTDTLANLLEPGDELPPGAQLTDTVTVTLTATAVHVP